MVDRRQFIKTAGAAGVAGMAGVSGCMGGGSGTTVSILTWTGYDDVNDQVEETLGDVTLDVSIADGSANMFSTVNAGGGEEYDIVIPNNEYVPRFIEADLAAPVDTDVVTNYDALYPTFQSAAEGQFADGGDVYGLPVQFGWYAYGYDTSVLPEDHEHSYDVLFSEEYEGVDLTGGITLYDGYYKSIMAAGLALGYTERDTDRLQTKSPRVRPRRGDAHSGLSKRQRGRFLRQPEHPRRDHERRRERGVLTAGRRRAHVVRGRRRHGRLLEHRGCLPRAKRVP
jgi:spermidine/putrescine-binding protein